MRYLASSLLVASIAVCAAQPLIAADVSPAKAHPAEILLAAQKEYGVVEETPNQKRTRLGQPIVESFPAPDYGVAMETPNQRRQRLAAQTVSLRQ